MSNKAEVEINGVYIYTHLGGSDVKQRVADALVEADRIDQPDYLTRVVIDEMEKDATGPAKGIGVAASSYEVLPKIQVQVGLGRITVIDWNDDICVYSPIQEFIDKWSEKQ